jgi:ribosome-binding ATPase YchF (GTP1/OBG family)
VKKITFERRTNGTPSCIDTLAFVTGLTSISGNHRLAKIKAWIDTNNPGDLLIPYSVSLEERLALMDSPEDQAKELEAIGGTSALGKITTAGYASLHVS